VFAEADFTTTVTEFPAHSLSVNRRIRLAISKFDPIPIRPIPGSPPVGPGTVINRPFGDRTRQASFLIDTQGRDVPRGAIRVGVHAIDLQDVDNVGDHNGERRITFIRNTSPASGNNFTLTIYATEAVSVRVTVWIRNPNWHPGDPEEQRFFVGFCAGQLVAL
jgi:hypothetical protein